MALQTVNQFPGIFATPDKSGIAQGIFQALTGVGQGLEKQRAEQQTAMLSQLKTTGAQFLRLRDMAAGPDADQGQRGKAFQKQRQELINLAKATRARGEDDSLYMEGLAIQNPDELNLFLRRTATRAVMASDKADAFLAKQAEGQLIPSASGLEFGNVNPGDFTPESLQAFIDAGGGPENFGLLERFSAPQVVDIGGVPHLVSRSGTGEVVAKPVPLSDLETEKTGQGAIAGARAEASTEAELNVEAGLGDSPGRAEVEAGVTKAREEAKAEVAEAQVEKQNAKAFKTYEVARNNLQSALENTMTGFMAGRLPALGASQQIAEAAENTLFPAIKALVREAGEGIFTDRDAEDVRKMLPTRKTAPEALPMVFWQIDAYVASKLGQPPPPPPEINANDDPLGIR